MYTKYQIFQNADENDGQKLGESETRRQRICQFPDVHSRKKKWF